MAFCTDALVGYLNQCGYCAISEPKAGIAPLEVIGEDEHGMRELGPITSMWKTKRPLPGVNAPQPALEIDGKLTGQLAASLGLAFLTNTLQAFGASRPNIAATYRQARSVRLGFRDVQSVAVPVAELQDYLRAGDLDSSDPRVTTYFLNPHRRVHIIHEVLLSDAISVIAAGADKREYRPDLVLIRQQLGRKVEVVDTDHCGKSLVYRGQLPLTFAIKTLELAFIEGQWQFGRTDNVEMKRLGKTGPLVLRR